jgi:hypothetical protein
VFARPGIPGCIFLEGRLNDVTAALKGLVTVYKAPPRLVPPAERGSLLSPRNPLSSTHSVRCGEWVRCLHGLYRGDVGLVCEVDPTSDASVIVAFLPRIPDCAAASAKRKRWTRPTPRLWYSDQVRAVWGEHRVRVASNANEYEFGGETYRTGLLIKSLPPASIVVADAPDDMGPFARSPYTAKLPFFDAMAWRYAQYSLIVGQRVRVISGAEQGLVGQPISITDGVADFVPQDDGVPPFKVPLEHLMPVYRPGDHVKYRWSDTHGIIISIEEPDLVSFIDTRTQNGVRTCGIALIVANHIFQFTTAAYCVTPYTPPHHFYQFKPGTWVDFRGPKDTERPKRRGCVHSIEDTHALIVEDRTKKEVREQIHIKMRLSYIIHSSG